MHKRFTIWAIEEEVEDKEYVKKENVLQNMFVPSNTHFNINVGNTSFLLKYGIL
jgi:hypothetical protein